MSVGSGWVGVDGGAEDWLGGVWAVGHSWGTLGDGDDLSAVKS